MLVFLVNVLDTEYVKGNINANIKLMINPIYFEKKIENFIWICDHKGPTMNIVVDYDKF